MSLTCIDLFAGCGGLGLGLQMAGFNPVLFSEINDSAAATYSANHPGVPRVADIHSLTDESVAGIVRSWGDVDLVCGGPPCQGYSTIGHRRTFNLEKEEIPSNRLYLEMARVVATAKPRAFLFENVRGLVDGRWTKTGRKGEIFEDVRRAFDAIPGYIVRWELLFSKDYGVPQNRPRVMMVGLREDVTRVRGPVPDEPTAVREGFLPAPDGSPPPSIDELFSDLLDPDYRREFVTKQYLVDPLNEVQRWLRTRPDGSVMAAGSAITDQEYSNHAPRIVAKYEHMIRTGGEIPAEAKTKKFCQRVLPASWGPGGPNVTVTSLPDDLIHYCQPRSPTVREWARMQMFPDWYVFEGPRTVGGRRRAGDPSKGVWLREVPKYTQIGNAVPVRLAERVGRHLAMAINGSG